MYDFGKEFELKQTFKYPRLNILILQNHTILYRYRYNQCAEISKYVHLCAHFLIKQCGLKGTKQNDFCLSFHNCVPSLNMYM